MTRPKTSRDKKFRDGETHHRRELKYSAISPSTTTITTTATKHSSNSNSNSSNNQTILLLPLSTSTSTLSSYQQLQSNVKKCDPFQSTTWKEFYTCSQGQYLSCQPPPPPHVWEASPSWEVVQRCLHGRRRFYNKNNNKKKKKKKKKKTAFMTNRRRSGSAGDATNNGGRRRRDRGQERAAHPSNAASENNNNSRMMMMTTTMSSAATTKTTTTRRNNNNTHRHHPHHHHRRLQIYLIGERHSGTKFVMEQLQHCFAQWPDILLIKRDFMRHKHFFQPLFPMTTTTRRRRQEMYTLRNALVISVVRNPYDWVAAMRRKPYHMPYHMKGLEFYHNNNNNNNNNHHDDNKNNDINPNNKNNNNNNNSNNNSSSSFHHRHDGSGGADGNGGGAPRRRRVVSPSPPTIIPLDWQDFVTRPWTTLHRTKADLAILQSNNTTLATCTMGFRFQEVVPCQMDPDSLLSLSLMMMMINNTNNSNLTGGSGTAAASNADAANHHNHNNIHDDYDYYSNILARGHEPVYELQRDGSGRPFESILQLRADKIRNFVWQVGSLPLGGFLTVRYEDLMQHGTGPLLRQVAQLLSWQQQQQQQQQRRQQQREQQQQKSGGGGDDDEDDYDDDQQDDGTLDSETQLLLSKCQPHRPQPERLTCSSPLLSSNSPSSSSSSTSLSRGNSKKVPSCIPPDFRQYLHDHIDWEMEKVVGYYPTDSYGLAPSNNNTYHHG